MLTEEGTGSVLAPEPQGRVPSSVATSGHGGGSGWRPFLRRDDEAKALPPAPPPLCAVALLILFLITLSACGGGGGGVTPPSGQIRTLAYAENKCREGPEGYSGAQALRVQRGDAAPVTVAEFSFGPSQSGAGLCRTYGEGRFGVSSVVVGVFHRLGVSPEGGLVVFEATDDFSLTAQNQLPTEREGIFVVRADGSGLRRLAPPSRAPSYVYQPAPVPVWSGPEWFAFSPDGLRVAFTDFGPGPDGQDALQVWVLDVDTGERAAVTRLPRVANPPFIYPYRAVAFPAFLTNDVITFLSYVNPESPEEPYDIFRHFTVKTDGQDLRTVPVIAQGGLFVPVFTITGAQAIASATGVPGVPVHPVPPPPGSSVREIFLFDTDRSLQLTTFQRQDTQAGFLGADGGQVFFLASADPLGDNPSQSCQVFSIDRFGSELCQLTHFSQGTPFINVCGGIAALPGCSIDGFMQQDRATQTIVFNSSCDPFGSNPNGSQLFAMLPDGTGLRQLTNLEGVVEEADGSLTVELPGPYAVPSGAVR